MNTTNVVAEQAVSYGERLVQSAPQLTVALAVGIALGWFGHVLSTRRENKGRIAKAKDTYSVFISRKLGEIPNAGYLDFYTKTKSEIKEQVFSLIPFLTDAEASQLKEAWNTYSKIGEQLSNDEAEYQELMVEAAKLYKEPKPGEKSGDVLHRHLEQLYKVVR